MANIQERSGKFRVSIRKKGTELSATFSDLETANLWANYKENLIDEIEAFKVPMGEMITLGDAIELKVEKASQDKLDVRSVQDIKNLARDFYALIDTPINKIYFGSLKLACLSLLERPTRIGGKSENSGRQVIPSVQTILSKLRRLASVYSNLKEYDIKTNNTAQEVLEFMKIRNKST